MAKRGQHFGFVTARVNANTETRAIIADSLDLADEMLDVSMYVRYDAPLDCAGACCPCCGCSCKPYAGFAAAFNAKQGKTANRRSV
jgi:hypothetical protein